MARPEHLPADRTMEVWQALADKFSELLVEPETISLRIALNIMEGETAEEILSPTGTVNAEDMGNAPFVLHSVEIMKSSFQDSIGFYALLHGTEINGETPITVNCGAANVVAQAAALQTKGHLPLPVYIERSARATARGYYPMSLRMATPEEPF